MTQAPIDQAMLDEQARIDYAAAVQARPPKSQIGYSPQHFAPELVTQVIEIMEQRFPGTMLSIKEIMRCGFDRFEENEEQSTKNYRALIYTCTRLRFVIDAADPYWTGEDLVSAIMAVAAAELDAESRLTIPPLS